jgi:hypothetical protein
MHTRRKLWGGKKPKRGEFVSSVKCQNDRELLFLHWAIPNIFSSQIGRYLCVCVCVYKKRGHERVTKNRTPKHREREENSKRANNYRRWREKFRGERTHYTFAGYSGTSIFLWCVRERLHFFSICLKFLDPEWKRSQQQNKTKTQSENISH